MNSLINLLNNDVKLIEPHHAEGDGIAVAFEDDTNMWIEHNLDREREPGDGYIISIWGTSVNGGTNTRVILDTHTLTKAKLVVQELTAIIERIESEI